jgi:hypothetical protein
MHVTVRRIWRLRKQQHHIDAELRDDGSDAVELRFSYDGKIASSRRWPTRRLAFSNASEKRQELERAGWVDHW